MSSILHISYDYGDGANNDVTNAVSNLIKQTKKITDTVILDISRVESFKKESAHKSNTNHLKLNVFGLPFGLFHKYHLNRVYKKFTEAEINSFINSEDIDLVHAHKLSFDGYIGYRFSLEWRVPLVVTLRQTDFMVLKFRPDLRSTYKKILKHSIKIIYLVPSMITLLKKRLGDNFFKLHIENKLVYLPNIITTPADFINNEVDDDAPLITILRLTKRSVKRKNLKKLFKAAAGINDVDFTLKVIGGGNYLSKAEEWIEKYGLKNKVIFTGAVANSEINKHYSDAKAFILPSYSESFGLVYAEALLNGTPILYSRGVLGFDGVFENVGCAVNPSSVKSIQEGIRNIVSNNRIYRAQIKKLKENNKFRIFTADYAADIYFKMYEDIMMNSTNKVINKVYQRNSRIIS